MERQPFWRYPLWPDRWATRKYGMKCEFAASSRDWTFFLFESGQMLSRHINGTEVWVKDSEDYYRTKHAYY